jgi:SAM-dependent methyltransferase
MDISEKSSERKSERVGEVVRENYGKIARGEKLGCGCGCSSGADVAQIYKSYAEDIGYTEEELGRIPEEANLGLGCGNPRKLAKFKPGETVLDLGSGAGVDCFNAARDVGEIGRVIGVDMTPDMISKSRENAEKAKVNNIDFRLGEIENLPVADSEIDAIISNCVINISPKKNRVYAEMFRTLKPGGRLAISDIVALKELPQNLQADLAMITACVGGAQKIGGIEAMLRETGFEDIRVEPIRGSEKIIATWFPQLGVEGYITSATITAVKPKRFCD